MNNILDHKRQLNKLQSTIKNNQDLINKFRNKLFLESEKSSPSEPLTNFQLKRDKEFL